MNILEKLRERGKLSHPKNVPTRGTEAHGRWLWNRPDLFTFPHAPCNWLCQRPNLKRFHLTCLTCMLRRFTFHKYRSENLRSYPFIMVMMQHPKNKRLVLPDNYIAYSIIVPTNPQGLVNPVKSGVIKVLMTIAERIGEF